MRAACAKLPSRTPTAEELALEYLRREDGGETPSLEAYLECVPHPLRATCRRRVKQLRQLRGLLEELGCDPFERFVPGTRFGAYRIVKELGHGGMATVYLALVEEPRGALEPGDRVALKVVHRHLDSRRLRREAEIGSELDHGNLVRVHEWGERHLVMEYVEGETLLSLLRRRGRLSERLCRHVGRSLAGALAVLHARGFVHRDLKPENVLLANDGSVKLLDLGVAHDVDRRTRLSRTGTFVGSVLYAAPEQFTGGEVDGRADLYSLGLLLYELATGSLPSTGTDPAEIMRHRLEDKGLPASSLSPRFAVLLGTLLAREPAARFRSAATVRDLLAEGRWRRPARSAEPATMRGEQRDDSPCRQSAGAARGHGAQRTGVRRRGRLPRGGARSSGDGGTAPP